MTVKLKLGVQDDVVTRKSEYQSLVPSKCCYRTLNPWFFVVTAIAIFLTLTVLFENGSCHLNRNTTLSSNGNTSDATEESYRLVCYYVIPSNNSHDRELPPDAVDPYFCSHLIVGFSSIENGTIETDDNDYLAIYKKIIAFKTFNPSLKVLLSVEDISSSGEFSKMVSSETYRTKFVVSTVTFLNKMGFDGLDLDWEFPSWPYDDLMQVKNFSALLFELKSHMLKEAPHLVLSAAVAAPALIIQQSYEVEVLAKYLDFVNVMCYDYHMFTPLTPITGPNSPLYSRPSEQGYWSTLNTDWSVSQWVSMGMPRQKINVGIPTFGHSYRLINEDNNGWNAPTGGIGQLGKGGFTTYPDACKFVEDADTTHSFDDNYQVPYAYNGNEWLSYETPQSVSLKAMYIKKHRFGGAMIFSLNSDDFLGNCGNWKFPLTREVNFIFARPD